MLDLGGFMLDLGGFMLDLGGFMLDIYFLENTNRSFNDLYLCYCGLEKCVPLY